MEKLCNNCKHRKKKQFTTLFYCEKFNMFLTDNPPKRCEQCMMEEKLKQKPKRKKDYIEVK